MHAGEGSRDLTLSRNAAAPVPSKKSTMRRPLDLSCSARLALGGDCSGGAMVASRRSQRVGDRASPLAGEEKPVAAEQHEADSRSRIELAHGNGAALDSS